jgi:PPM family protein phosphatase
VISVERSNIKAIGATHPGSKGKNNEDQYAFQHYQISEDGPTPSTLAVVSDGIGGHRAGEIAAQIAVETIFQVVSASDGSRPNEILRDAIITASDRIRQQAEADPKKKGMGATCACAWVIGNRLYTASVGDTRIYWIRGEKIKKLSIDHTWIQEAIDIGALSQDEARDHPHAHVIRRYLGSPNPVIPDLRLRLRPQETDEQSEANQGLRLVPEDFLLLCSDGLTDLVEDSEILSALRTKRLDQAVSGLIELANERGGHDNITIIAMQVSQKAREAAPPVIEPASEKRALVPGLYSCIGLGALLLLSLLLAGSFYWFLTQTPPIDTPTPTLSAELPPVLPFDETPTGLPLIVPSPDIPILTPATPTPVFTPPPPRPTYTPWPTATP